MKRMYGGGGVEMEDDNGISLKKCGVEFPLHSGCAYRICLCFMSKGISERLASPLLPLFNKSHSAPPLLKDGSL